jgi:hypothetical protein
MMCRGKELRTSNVARKRATDADSTFASNGRALDQSTRRVMEQRFEHDFSRVRVHDDADAHAVALDLGAAAFAVGTDIGVSSGFDLTGPLGTSVLAHELAHVVQFDRHGSANDGESISREGDGAETEATLAQSTVMHGHAAPSIDSAAPPVALFSMEQLWNTITDNSLSGAVGYATEASKDASSILHGAAGEASGIPWLGRALGPLGIISNVMGMDKALDTGGAQGAGDFTASAMGVLGSAVPTLELLSAGAGAMGLGTTATAGAAGTGIAGGLGSAATALGPIGALAGSAAGGYALGTHLYNNTSVGERSQDALGWLDDKLTGEGERSWMLRQTEEFDEAWDDGDVLGVLGNGLQIGGVATAGAIGGLAGGAYDAGAAVVGGIGDAASYIKDNVTLDPDEIDWGRTFSPWDW